MCITIEDLKQWKELHPNGFESIAIDISGFCNAKCKYCPAGNDLSHWGEFIHLDDYERILEKLLSYGMLTPASSLHIYSLGEPLLHPQLNEILKITDQLGLKTNISTNASILPTIDEGGLKAVARILISMPGFSQGSYDKIHGFNFEKIKQNVISLKTIFPGIPFDMSYHIYQFNQNELEPARDFCLKNQIRFSPNYAVLIDKNKCIDYVDNRMSYEELKDISKELFLGVLDYQISVSSRDYCDFQNNFLSVTEKGEIRICSGYERSYEQFTLCGNILTDEIDEIIKLKYNHPKCRKCISAGLTCDKGCDCKVYPDSYYSLMKENELIVEHITIDDKENLSKELLLIHQLRLWEQEHFSTLEFEKLSHLIETLNFSMERLQELTVKYARFSESTWNTLKSAGEFIWRN